MNDGNPFSTDDALAGSWDPKNTIEDYIAQNSYKDHPLYDEDDELAAVSVMLRGYQNKSIEMLSEDIGYYVTGIRRLAWMRGLDVLDDRMSNSLWKVIRQYKGSVDWIIREYQHDGLTGIEEENISDIGSVKDPYNTRQSLSGYGELDKTVSFRVLPKQKSRINTTFKEVMDFGAWIHRALIDLGLSGSRRIPRSRQEMFDGAVDPVVTIIHNQTVQPLKILLEYLVRCENYWVENGVHKDVLMDIRRLASYGQFEASRMIRNEIDRIMESNRFEIINPSEHDYRRLEETQYMSGVGVED